MAEDLIDVEDENGNRYRISAAHRNRYPSVQEAFRLVPEKKATPVVEEAASATVKPPTADKKKEN